MNSATTYETSYESMLALSNQLSEMQLDVIHGYITRSYWAKGISKELVNQSMQNSLCFGAFISDQQVAFARVITDKTTFGYLADVFVLEPYQGRGISKDLMRFVLGNENLQNLRRLMLCTADAHGLYKQFDFEIAKKPENLMVIHKADLYAC